MRLMKMKILNLAKRVTFKGVKDIDNLLDRVQLASIGLDAYIVNDSYENNYHIKTIRFVDRSSVSCYYNDFYTIEKIELNGKEDNLTIYYNELENRLSYEALAFRMVVSLLNHESKRNKGINNKKESCA